MKRAFVVLVAASAALGVASGAHAQAHGWAQCGVVRAHGDDGIVRLEVSSYTADVSCKRARSVIRRAWRLPKPTATPVRRVRGWTCSVHDRDDGGFCGRAGTKTWVLMARNPARGGATTYVPVG